MIMMMMGMGMGMGMLDRDGLVVIFRPQSALYFETNNNHGDRQANIIDRSISLEFDAETPKSPVRSPNEMILAIHVVD